MQDQPLTNHQDMRYKCPGTYISSQFDTQAHSLGSWNYLWNVTDPTQAAQGLGVPHTVEVNAIFGCASVNGGCPASYVPGGSNAGIVPVVQGYWTSFIRYVTFCLLHSSSPEKDVSA